MTHLSTKVYLGLGVRLVIDLGTVIPVFWLLGLWIFDFLWRQEIPVLLQRARLHLLVINLHLIGLIGLQDQCVQVSQFIILQETTPEEKPWLDASVAKWNCQRRAKAFVERIVGPTFPFY